jgi:hypothetical protein
MRTLIRMASSLAIAFVLVGCASGPKYPEVKSSLPALSAEQGRIWFYRSGTMFGSGIQPSVVLNGEKVGESTPGGFFIVDRPPGNYEVMLSTEVERKLTFTLDKGQERFVRMTVGLGVIVYRVYPELKNAEEARAEINGLSFTGKATSK